MRTERWDFLMFKRKPISPNAFTNVYNLRDKNYRHRPITKKEKRPKGSKTQIKYAETGNKRLDGFRRNKRRSAGVNKKYSGHNEELEE